MRLLIHTHIFIADRGASAAGQTRIPLGRKADVMQLLNTGYRYDFYQHRIPKAWCVPVRTFASSPPPRSAAATIGVLGLAYPFQGLITAAAEFYLRAPSASPTLGAGTAAAPRLAQHRRTFSPSRQALSTAPSFVCLPSLHLSIRAPGSQNLAANLSPAILVMAAPLCL